MESVANELLAALEVADRLRRMDEATASKRPAPGKWSKKEILGHLIDSAANNHQTICPLATHIRASICRATNKTNGCGVQHYQEHHGGRSSTCGRRTTPSWLR